MNRKSFSLAIILIMQYVFLTDAFSAYPNTRGKIHFKGFGILRYLIDDEAFLSEAGISSQKVLKIKTVLLDSNRSQIPLLALMQIESINFTEELNKVKINRTKIFLIAKRMHEISWKIREIQLNTHLLISQMFNNNERISIRKALQKHFRVRFFRHSPPNFRAVSPEDGPPPPPPQD